jgi:mitochondrial fission protein ELM1
VDLIPAPGAPTVEPTLNIWVLSDGRAGIENQALGLAEAVARLRPSHITLKRIQWRPQVARLPSRLIPPWAGLFAPGTSELAPPWPDLLIANGRASLPISIAMRRWTSGRTFVVQLQNPRRSLRHFDLVIPPAHDSLSGLNVFPITGTPHRVTSEKLEAAVQDFADQLAPLPHPRLAVLIGGKAKAYDLSPARARNLADQIAEAVSRSGGSLMLTFSRRTPAEARQIFTERLQGLPGIIWDDTGLNPFFAFLGAADAIAVTEDSANMPAEAASTGKPVYLLPMDGGQKRRRLFIDDLSGRGVTRWFEGQIESWNYPPLQETDRAAREVLARMARRD